MLNEPTIRSQCCVCCKSIAKRLSTTYPSLTQTKLPFLELASRRALLTKIRLWVGINLRSKELKFDRFWQSPNRAEKTPCSCSCWTIRGYWPSPKQISIDLVIPFLRNHALFLAHLLNASKWTTNLSATWSSFESDIESVFKVNWVFHYTPYTISGKIMHYLLEF